MDNRATAKARTVLQVFKPLLRQFIQEKEGIPAAGLGNSKTLFGCSAEVAGPFFPLFEFF